MTFTEREACSPVLEGEAASFRYRAGTKALTALDLAQTSLDGTDLTSVVGRNERACVAVFVRCAEINRIGGMKGVAVLDFGRLFQVD